MNKEYFGQYKVDGELGRGGMGVVYKAHDESLNRHVAIKVLAERLASDDSVVERFKREARSMAALNDAHIIQIYFIGEDDGQPYFVMEFVEGESLSQRLKREGKLSVADSLSILRQTAEGLATAHRRGVVHRDIKPGNLMLTPEGKVKIADFGIAMVQDFSKRLTNTGEFVGTPGYLSPEVCVGQPVDQRSDIFALGIVLYEMLTGNIPFTEASPLGMMLEVVKAEIPDVRTVNADVDDRTCQILSRMIAKDPDHRYQTCDELLADLTGTAPVASPAAGVGGDFEQARTTALSQLEAMPELASSTAATVVSVPGGQPSPAQQAAARPADPPRRSKLPLAIAALLVLGVAGGAVFVFQDQILGTADEQRLATAQDVETVEDESAALERELIAASQAGTPADGPVSGDSAQDQSGLRVAEATASGGGRSSGPALRMADTGEVSDAAADQAPVQVTLVPEQADQSAAGSSGAAQSKAAAEPAEEAPVQLAAVTRPPPQAAAPREPRLVVIAVGDRAIAGPVEQLLENELLNEKLTVMDEAFFPDIGRYAGEQGVDLAGLSGVIQDNGGDVLVLAEVDYIGETPLQYYGQYSTLYSVNVKIRNILLNERRPLGPGWSSKVDFTSLNADEKAREAVEPILDEVSSSLRDLKIRG